jgi:hypothetical protein
VSLIQMRTHGHNVSSARIIIQPFPERTLITIAGLSGRSPYRAIVVQLIELIAASGDSLRPGVVVEKLPARAGIATAGRGVVAPDLAVLV